MRIQQEQNDQLQCLLKDMLEKNILYMHYWKYWFAIVVLGKYYCTVSSLKIWRIHFCSDTMQVKWDKLEIIPLWKLCIARKFIVDGLNILSAASSANYFGERRN